MLSVDEVLPDVHVEELPRSLPVESPEDCENWLPCDPQVEDPPCDDEDDDEPLWSLLPEKAVPDDPHDDEPLCPLLPEDWELDDPDEENDPLPITDAPLPTIEPEPTIDPDPAIDPEPTTEPPPMTLPVAWDAYESTADARPAVLEACDSDEDSTELPPFWYPEDQVPSLPLFEACDCDELQEEEPPFEDSLDVDPMEEPAPFWYPEDHEDSPPPLEA